MIYFDYDHFFEKKFQVSENIETVIEGIEKAINDELGERTVKSLVQGASNK